MGWNRVQQSVKGWDRLGLKENPFEVNIVSRKHIPV
jgi:hypothetical protein